MGRPEGEAWTAREETTLRRLWDNTKSCKANYAEIGAVLGRSIHAVRRRADRMALKSNHPAPPVEEVVGVEGHAEACLAEGGFPAARITPHGTVWDYPSVSAPSQMEHVSAPVARVVAALEPKDERGVA